MYIGSSYSSSLPASHGLFSSCISSTLCRSSKYFLYVHFSFPTDTCKVFLPVIFSFYFFSQFYFTFYYEFAQFMCWSSLYASQSSSLPVPVHFNFYFLLLPYNMHQTISYSLLQLFLFCTWLLHIHESDSIFSPAKPYAIYRT